MIFLIILALLEEWPQSGPQSLRWIETDQFRGSWSLSESTARVLAIVVALAQLPGASVSLLRRPIRALVLAHVAHMLKVAVTDPGNPDYPGIPDGTVA
jgi:hypothetical protein